MKTIIDAVNEFKGVYVFDWSYMYFEEGTGNEGFFAGKSSYQTDANHYLVCTRDEFNECVEEMTDGTLWASEPKQAPALKKAEESRIEELEAAFNEITTESEYDACYDIACAQLDLSTADDKQASVYTQELSDAGVLPPVGVRTKLKVSSEYFTNRCPLAGEAVCVTAHFKTSSGKELCAYMNDAETQGGVSASCAFEPTDTRTDEEKAIDDIRKVDQSIHENINFEQDFLNEIKAGKIHGVTFNPVVPYKDNK